MWALFPDKYEGGDKVVSRSGAFTTTLVAFFCAEIGDKTQIATVGLAARFEAFYFVVIGTTLGMMLANIPAVVIGDKLAGRLPVKAIRLTTAIVFASIGIIHLERGPAATIHHFLISIYEAPQPSPRSVISSRNNRCGAASCGKRCNEKSWLADLAFQGFLVKRAAGELFVEQPRSRRVFLTIERLGWWSIERRLGWSDGTRNRKLTGGQPDGNCVVD